MSLVEDMVKGNLVAAAAIGATALVLPKVLPALSPQMRSVVKGGLSLFLESESEAEGGIIDRLADNALKNVLASLSGPGSADEKREAARAAVEHYKRRSHTRARRYQRSESDRAARYDRHIAALRGGLKRARSRRTGAEAAALQDLLTTLDAA